VDEGLARHVATLVATWEAFARTAVRDAAPSAAGDDAGRRRPPGRVVRGPGWVAARLPDPVLCNALLLEPDAGAVRAVQDVYGAGGRYALWTHDGPTAAVAETAGLVRDATTRAMLCRLDTLRPAVDGRGLVFEDDVDPARVALLNGVPTELVAGVSGLRALVAGRDAEDVAGVLTFRHGDDLNVSFLVTRPDARRAGIAGALMTRALRDGRDRGARTATLQATTDGESLYRRLGFVPVGRWQEWVPA
jgi:ribosomal protein S18 acetylase RimI-like enzyme